MTASSPTYGFWQRFQAPTAGLTGLLGRIPGELAGRAIALAMILGAATFLRVIELGRIGLNSDEAVYSGQAGALAGDLQMEGTFSVFRAHPLLLQTLLGGWYGIVGDGDVAARVFVALIFGVGSVLLTYMVGSKLFGTRVGLVAAAMLAVLPYHVLVSRQVMLDSPLAFFVLLTMWFAAHLEDDTSGRWVVWAGVSAGLATMSKEVGVLLVPVLVILLITSGQWRRIPWYRTLLGGAVYAILTLPYPLSRMLFAPDNGSSYLLWQFSRKANHDSTYFLEVLGSFGGMVFLLLAVTGILLILATTRGHRRMLMLLWIVVFFGFFQAWPTKLFAYLMPLVPAFAICAALTLDRTAQALTSLFRRRWEVTQALPQAALAIAVLLFALQLGGTSLSNATAGPEKVGSPLKFDIEVQDFAGGRELGEWAKANTPEDARFLTIGPSLGNVLRYYGDRESVALSVSSDPQYRNPAYVPVENPDLWFRQLGIHYIVWDFYSADRSAFYNGRISYYARKFGGAVLFSIYERADGTLIVGAEDGAKPRIIVYDAIGGDPLGKVPPAGQTDASPATVDPQAAQRPTDAPPAATDPQLAEQQPGADPAALDPQPMDQQMSGGGE